MKSKIFVRNATLLDCAILAPSGVCKGQSFQVNILWEGHLDSEEVVYDFGLAKKNAKSTIDDLYDHRLLVGQSQVSSESDGTFTVQWQDSTQGTWTLNTYQEGLAFLSDEVVAQWEQGHLEPLAQHISHSILASSPDNISHISVELVECGAHLEHHFNYLHSLPRHFGNCQRFHGHSNIVEVFENGEIDPERCIQVAETLDGKYFISEKYIVDEGCCSETVFVRYAGSQGAVTLSLPRERCIVMPCESTIENISAYILENVVQPRKPGTRVLAYEGISKGAVVP